MESIIEKIISLLRLAASSNENESANAKAFAEKLMLKHNITQAQLDKKSKENQPLYNEQHFLYSTPELIGWKSLLAFAISQKFFCYVVEEQNKTSLGDITYTYFMYGDDNEEIDSAKLVFNNLINQIDLLVLSNCNDKEEDYIYSYCEGLVSALKFTIENELFIEEYRKPRNILKVSEQSKDKIEPLEKDFPKEKPVEKTTKVAGRQLIKDAVAYFKDEADGSKIKLNKLLS